MASQTQKNTSKWIWTCDKYKILKLLVLLANILLALGRAKIFQIRQRAVARCKTPMEKE